MADAISIQELIDARTDAKTLEEAVNGDAVTTVLSRLGESYPTLANALSQIDGKLDSADAQIKQAITDLFQNGGLPATPFATKALMTASALVDGDYAQVTDDTVDNGLYVKTAGAWVKSAYDPVEQAKAYTDEKTENTSAIKKDSDYAFSIKDENGSAAVAINNDGGMEIADANIGTLKVGSGVLISDDEYAWSVSDENKNTAIGVLNNGTTLLASLDTKELKINGQDFSAIVGGSTKDGNYPANLNHFEIYGQSLSQGAHSLPIQTTVQNYDSLMFVGGIRPQHPSYDVPNFYADFIPLIEKADISGYVGGETPCGGATDAVKQLIAEENGISFDEQQYQLLGTACGEGGMSINALSTTYFESNLKPAITSAYNLAQAKGMTYAMPVIGWVQGEEDNKSGTMTSIVQYKDRMQTLISLIDSHLKTLNSELTLKGMIAGQLCSFKSSGKTAPHIELAIYEAATAPSNNIYLACPFYIFDYKDPYHIDGVSSKWMGAYIGLVYKRVVVDGENWLPVHPISHVKQGKILEVKFHVPVRPLVFDTDYISLNTNYGFELVDASNAPITINSVEITQGDTVKIITATEIPDGAKLRYAWTPSAAPNRTTGPRGNLRDSQGNKMIFDPNGINKPMHNWTPIFQYEV